MSQFIDKTNLDFLSYRESLKAYLETQEAFKDYDFEGSNWSVLLDILAYNSLNNAYYENMIGSEMFLDTALLKDSAISRAKELNYTPRSRSSARTTTTITIDDNGTSPEYITIPKFYNIVSEGFDENNNSKTYNFVTNTAVSIQSDVFGNYVAEDVEIYQGVAVKEAYTANTNTRFIMQSNTIDISSIEVIVQNSNTDNTRISWSKAEDIYGLTSESNVFFVQAYLDDKYEIVFGNDVIGRAITPGNIVRISYISTEGENGNDLISFKPTVSVQGFDVQSIIADTKTTGGSERESIESIKFQAPRHFTTQERAVISSDFENLVLKQFPIIQAVIAIGGEDLDEPKYGKVAIVLKPYGDYGVVSNKTKQEIYAYLLNKSITTEPMIIDPEYFYIRVDSTVYYDPNLLTIPLNQLKNNVLQQIDKFGNDNLTNFDSDFKYSKFIKSIDDTDVSITSNDTTVKLIKRWNPLTGSVQSYKFSFGIPLKKYEISNELDEGIEPTFTSSTFSYIVGGLSYVAKIEDNGIGTLKIVSNSKNKVVLNNNVGSINYETGEINIMMNISSYNNYISLYATSRSKDLIVNKQRFLILDNHDVLVNIEQEKD